MIDPIVGAGLGLRPCHEEAVLAEYPSVPWFEMLADNYLNQAPVMMQKLELIRERYPLTLHGVGLSLGSAQPLSSSYLKQLKALQERLQPAWISDHLSWSFYKQAYLNELLPMPLTAITLTHISNQIDQAQAVLKQPLLIENISSYVCYAQDEMPEWDFLNKLAAQTGCKILLDVNNIFVNAHNHRFSASDYLKNIHPMHVAEIHLAGHTRQEETLIDTHNCEVAEPVWDLYQKALAYFGPIPTLIEWDNQIPALSVLMAEAKRAQMYLDKY